MLVNTSTPNPPDDAAKATLYQIKSAIPGRIRWHIRGLKNSTYQQKLTKFLESLNGVTHIRLNPIAESIIVSFSENKLSSTDLQEKFAQAILQTTSVKSSLPPSTNNLDINEHKKTEKQKITVPETKKEKSFPQSVNKAEKKTRSLPLLTPKKPKPDQTDLSKVEAESSLTQPESLSEQEITPPNFDAWLPQCQEQAKIIEQLEHQLAQLLSTASIGANLLHKGDIYNSNKNKPQQISTPPTHLPSLETLEKQGNWQQLAQRQREKIAQLQQEVSEQQRLSAIAEFHLNKWRHRFFH